MDSEATVALKLNGPLFGIAINAIMLGGLYCLVAVALNLQYGLTRTVNVAHGEFIMLGGYVTYWLFTLYGVSPILSVVVTGPLMFAIGLLLYGTVLRKLLGTYEVLEVFEANSILVAFGLLFVIQNIALLLWTGTPRYYRYLTDNVQVFTATVPLNRIAVFLFATLASLIFYFFLRKTLVGKAMRAVMQHRIGAAALGINVSRLFAISFGLGVGMAGMAGSLVSMLFTLTPAMGMPFTTVAFLMIILGGLGNMLGSLIASFIIAAAQIFSGYYTNPGFALIIIYLIFIIILIVRPQGLLKG